MRKFLTVLLSVAAACCIAGALACHTHTYSDEWTSDASYHWHEATCGHDDVADKASHTWVATDSTDENGYTVYKCSVCGYTHAHTYSSAWTTDTNAHWHASNCGHGECITDYEDHQYEDGTCIICGYSEADAAEYSVSFSYYTDDNESGEFGDTVYDESNNAVSDTYRGVTYTAVESSSGLLVDIGGDTVLKGDTIAFTIKKSVYCEYTDGNSYAVVEVVYADGDEMVSDIVTPDADGVYTYTVYSDIVITVNNVETMGSTISGGGTASNPYVINTVADWLYFANYINNKSYYINITYNIAYWKLGADLDFEGESIYIIGDGYSSTYSMFMGNFDGDGHKLTNFTIDNLVYDTTAEYSTYVGVFGVVSGYAGVDTCIKNLTVENFTVDAAATADSVVVAGGLVGYLAGASVVNCHVKDCTINITADEDYSSYGGGIAGMCQSGYSDSEGIIFYTSIQYCTVDAEIGGTGYIYEIGGIVGRAIPYGAISPVFIYNCYTSGLYTDATQSGGIVGYMARYTTVQNCYSTAEIVTTSSLTSVTFGTTYANTPYDYRYSLAGGIAGYAENDTVISGCFYAGDSLSATASAGSDFAKTGEIIAMYCEAGFEDYRASAVLLTDNLSFEIYSSYEALNAALKAIGWNEADWIFGSGYPEINTEETERIFTITVVIGSDTKTYTIDSLYRPMAYWYVQAANGEDAIPEYLTSGTTSTYGYFFDEDLTVPVTAGYVPMNDITLYAAYADFSEVVGSYVVSSNGITATLTLYNNGTYSLDQGAIYLTGNYVYNGEYITMSESYFARFSASATETQQATYYTFWAELDENGDLKIYDCDALFAVDDTYDGYGFTYLARMFAYSSPLLAVEQSKASICGDYYSGSYTFTFNVDYTGSMTTGDEPISLTYYYNNNGVLCVAAGDLIFTAEVENGRIVSLTNSNTGRLAYTLYSYDDFMGTWEQTATIAKKYTFDGKGGWTYYVDGVKAESGSYDINSNEALVFTRSNGTITVTVTLNSDGTLNVSESTGSVGVTYYGEGGYQGTWYTAAAQSKRYTLELSGLNGDGIGSLDLSGYGVSITDLRYISDGGVLYAYEGDTLYATLTYDSESGVLEGAFYDSSTEALDTLYTFYLYDNFYGDWFGDIEGLEKLTFNGLGLYNVAASVTDGTIAVKGSVTIGSSSVSYGLGENGEMQFTYNNIVYTITYDEYNNEVTVTYDGGSGKLIAGDSLYGVSYKVNGEVYAFDGAGNLDEGGTVTITGSDTKTASYKIDAAGVITVTYNGTTYATFTPVTDEDGEVTGYSVAVSGATYTATVENAFTGVWAVVGGYVTFTVPEIYYFVEGTVVPLTVYYTDPAEGYDNYALEAWYDGTVIWFAYDLYTTYYLNNISGTILLSSVYDSLQATSSDTVLPMCASDGYCLYYTKGSDSVKLSGDTLYSKNDGYGNALLVIGGEEMDCWYTVDESGNITIYSNASTPVALYTFNVTSDTSEYSGGSDYRVLAEVTE